LELVLIEGEFPSLMNDEELTLGYPLALYIFELDRTRVGSFDHVIYFWSVEVVLIALR